MLWFFVRETEHDRYGAGGRLALNLAPAGTVQSLPMMLSAGRRLLHAASALAFIQGRNSVRPHSLMSSFM